MHGGNSACNKNNRKVFSLFLQGPSDYYFPDCLLLSQSRKNNQLLTSTSEVPAQRTAQVRKERQIPGPAVCPEAKKVGTSLKGYLSKNGSLQKTVVCNNFSQINVFFNKDKLRKPCRQRRQGSMTTLPETKPSLPGSSHQPPGDC